MSLLGSMILDPRVIADVVSIIKGPDDFSKESHGHIYRAIVEIFDTHNSGDLVQVADLLKQRQVYDQMGGADYLVQLAEAVPSAVNAKHYARIVAEKAKLRRLIDTAGQILYDAYHTGDLGPDGAREVLDRAEMAVFDIAQEQDSMDPQVLSELLDAEMRRIESEDFEGAGYRGVRTGYAELDELLRGLQPGELVIIAARPSMGKTALALNLAEQVAIGGLPLAGAPAAHSNPIAVFSLEMSKNAIVQRMLSARSGVSSQALRGGHKIPDDDLRRIYEAADDLAKAPIYVDDTPNMTVLQLRARARRLVAQYGVKCIMIDYLQLMTAPGAARESRQVEVSAISRGVKALARELNVPVVCLSQLNRASEQREGNRPRMADLRESGSIEQDADVIVLLHREDYYHTQNPDWALENPDKVGIAELIIAKQRNGPTGVVKLKWDSRTTRFRDYDPHASAPMGSSLGETSPYAASHNARRGGYASPSQAAQDFGNPFTQSAIEAKPEPPPFAPGRKTGPIQDHRDGGGPDRDDPDSAD
jgi:replicative DNA helicase